MSLSHTRGSSRPNACCEMRRNVWPPRDSQCHLLISRKKDREWTQSHLEGKEFSLLATKSDRELNRGLKPRQTASCTHRRVGAWAGPCEQVQCSPDGRGQQSRRTQANEASRSGRHMEPSGGVLLLEQGWIYLFLIIFVSYVVQDIKVSPYCL